MTVRQVKNHPESLPAIVMRLLTYLGEHYADQETLCQASCCWLKLIAFESKE